jgi:hypothetical protein
MRLNGVGEGVSPPVEVGAFPRFTVGETATGRGTQWPGTSNWFMYTGYTTSKVDLIAGQHHDAGDIFMSRSSGVTTIRIQLHTPRWRWQPGVQDVLKIHPMDRAPGEYIQPGAFQYKFTINPDGTVSSSGGAVGATYDQATQTLTVGCPVRRRDSTVFTVTWSRE